jgi:hypothetical protein
VGRELETESPPHHHQKGHHHMPSPDTTQPDHENPLLEDHLELLRNPAEKLLMAALRSGDYRLAVQCKRCGTWLVATTSVKKHLGPVCARNTAAEGGAA